MVFSDKDLQIVTQIAYMDFDERAVKSKDCSLKELLENHSNYLKNAERSLKNATPEMDRQRAQAQIDLYNEIVKDGSKYSHWKIIDVRDDNDRNGFYACTIDAGNGEAIVGFRGSEDWKDPIQFLEDWIKGDLGLLNSIETNQQECADNYMKYLYEKYGDDYDGFALTGHSLGGNLAFHAAVSAPDEMKDKITQAISFDGPGYSDEYIKAHYEEIQKVAPKLRHYVWSPVGALLYPLPSVEAMTIQTKDAPKGEEGMYFIVRHDTCFVEFSENGYVLEGPRAKDLEMIADVSQYIEQITHKVGIIGAFEFISIFLLDPVNVIRKAVVYSRMKQLCLKVVEWIDMNFTSSIQTANFEVKLNTVRQVCEEEESIAKELDSIADEIIGIKRQLSGGIWMWGIKTKLGRIVGNIDKQKKSMKKMNSVAVNIICQYEQVENRIISNRSVVLE